jgi:predicted MFS family arabinose efflux permease
VSLPRSSRAALLILACATFLGVLTENLPIGVLPEMAHDLGVRTQTVGMTVSGYAFAVALTAVPLTAATARRARRALLTVLLLTYAASSLGTAIATTFPVLLLARLLGGLSHGVFWSIIAGYAATLVSARQRGRATAIVFAGNAIALALGLPAGTAIARVIGWRGAFAAIAALAALVALGVWLVLPRVPADGGSAPSDPGALGSPAVRSVVVLTGIVMLAHFAFFTYVTPYLRHVGVPPSQVSIVLLAYGVCGVLGTVLAGRVVDRWPARSLLASIGLLAMALAVIAASDRLAIGFVPSIAVWGAAYTGLTVCLQVMILVVAGPDADTASSAYVAAFNLGIGGGALLGGLVIGQMTITALPAVAAVLAALTAGCGMLAARRIPQLSPGFRNART